MTVLSSDRHTPMQDAGVICMPMAAGAVIHAGALTVVNAAGFGERGTTAPGLRYAGRAEEAVSNAHGSNGARHINVRRLCAFKWANDGSINQSHYLGSAYIVDDQTVSATDGTATRSIAGRIVGIESDGVWVE